MPEEMERLVKRLAENEEAEEEFLTLKIGARALPALRRLRERRPGQNGKPGKLESLGATATRTIIAAYENAAVEAESRKNKRDQKPGHGGDAVKGPQ